MKSELVWKGLREGQQIAPAYEPKRKQVISKEEATERFCMYGRHHIGKSDRVAETRKMQMNTSKDNKLISKYESVKLLLS